MVPTQRVGQPLHEGVVGLVDRALRKARLSTRVGALADFATTIRPEVPTSSRETMPCRSAGPAGRDAVAGGREPAQHGGSGPADARVRGHADRLVDDDDVVVVVDDPHARAPARRRPRGSGAAARPAACTSSMSPALTRSDLPTSAALTLTPPAAARSAARVRESPNSRAMAASTRSPRARRGRARCGRQSSACLGRGAPAAVEGDAAEGEHHDDARRATTIAMSATLPMNRPK